MRLRDSLSPCRWPRTHAHARTRTRTHAGAQRASLRESERRERERDARAHACTQLHTATRMRARPLLVTVAACRQAWSEKDATFLVRAAPYCGRSTRVYPTGSAGVPTPSQKLRASARAMNASMSVQRFSMCLGISALHRKHTPTTWRTCQHAAGRRSRSVATSKRVFALCAMQHMSVADTVLQCIAHKDKRHMLKLKNDFRLSDRRWCWLQVRGTRHPQHTHTRTRTRKHARKHKLCARARTRQACVEHACRRQRRNVACKAELAVP